MNVWYINSILGAICLEEENDALCGVHFCPDGAPELEPLPRRVVATPLFQEAEEPLNESFAGVRRAFALPAVGDIRARIMALADRSLEGNPETAELLGYRHPKDAGP